MCTAAFGMGVDVPNVDVVMRIGCPPTVEELVKEFGRAGRDGRPAKGEVTATMVQQHCEIINLLQESCYLVRAIYSMQCTGVRTNQKKISKPF